MYSARSLLITILLAVSLLGAAFPTAEEPVAVPSPVRAEASADTDTDRITVDADEERGHELVEWAVGRYHQAGLTVPGADVHFQRGLEGCRGYVGLHTVQSGRHRIGVCDPGQRSRERIILHEFAHAWVGETLTSDNREAFLALCGLEMWHDPDTDWGQRGTEHAAEVMFWGLSDECRTPGRIGTDDSATLAAAFEFLTGTEPLCEIVRNGSAIPTAISRIGGPAA
jgi:hypothetical protein